MEQVAIFQIELKKIPLFDGHNVLDKQAKHPKHHM